MSERQEKVVSLTLGEIASRLGAQLEGDPTVRIDGVAGIESAGPSQISFISNPRYAGHSRTTQAAALLVNTSFPTQSRPTLRLDNPYLAVSKVLAWFHPEHSLPAGIHPTAVIAESAQIGAQAHVGAYVVVMDDVIIGDTAVLLSHVVIYPGARIGNRFFAHAHAVVRENCRIGDNVVLQNGAVIGADGFGFARESSGVWVKIPQVASAVLENDVEVQANSCIDRASLGETRIGRGTKIDNLVQVGHGSTVATDSLLCSQVGLAGSTRIGSGVILAGQVGVAGHCTIGDGVVATAQSGIPNDVPAGMIVSGYPAVENRRWLKSVAVVNRLPELIRNLRSGAKVTPLD